MRPAICQAAQRQLNDERAGHTLSATALVHEAFLRLQKRVTLSREDRTLWLAAAAEEMRRILIDHARARAAVKIAVVANGDLREIDDLAACAGQSQCEAFMIGRGAMARPELFAQIRGHVQERMSRPALAELLIRYQAMLLASGVSEGRALARVKQWLRMAADMDAAMTPLFDALKVLPAWEPFVLALRAAAELSASPSGSRD